MSSESIYAPRGETEKTDNIKGPLDHQDEAPTNPYLTKSSLFIHDLDASISDKELASAVFAACLPVRLHIDRTKADAATVSGSVEFQTLAKAEKAYATIKAPRLSINEDPSSDPKPQAKARLIKQLPHGTEDADIYDMFRPYGPIEGASRILTNPAGHHTGFRGMALVVFYHENDAQEAQTEMHCAELEGKTISVAIDTLARRPSAQTAGFSAAAAPFVPGASALAMNANAPAFHPPSRSSPGQSPLSHPQGGSAVAIPGTNLQYSSSQATYIDPCNLFCKNLDPSIDSNELFTLFKGFGKIISARVMRDERGVSREFGFVSYRRPEDAGKALSAMNGSQHGTKQMIVRLHEPKNVRQEKLSHKFGTSYQPDSPNDGGSPRDNSDMVDSTDNIRPRRMSNSYFRAAASGENGDDSLDLEQLQSMNSTLRGDILRGGFDRRVKDLPDIKASEVDSLVSELSKLQLPDAISAWNDRDQLAEKVAEIQGRQALASVAASASGDAPSVASAAAGPNERERLLKAVTDLSPAGVSAEAITDLLVGLSKKERAMALFNQDYLRLKVDEAKTILELGDDDEGLAAAKKAQLSSTEASPLTQANLAQAAGEVSNGAKASGPTPSAQKSYTLAELARMPAVDIIRLSKEASSESLPLSRADPSVAKETDDFIDGLQDLAPHDQKQKLGDQLFKKIRTFGFKGAPKITIALLDSEDLRSLAHLMNSYPECLREKVALQAGQASK